MRTFTVLLIFSLCLVAHRAPAQDSSALPVRGILVAASNEAREADSRLARYEPTLRRVLRFASYRQLGAGQASIAAPGSGRVSLGEGHYLEITLEPSNGGRVRAQLRWLDGDRTLMNTGVVLRRGVPAVLGGPARGDEVLAVIVVAQ
jgi:hypothetical protein